MFHRHLLIAAIAMTGVTTAAAAAAQTPPRAGAAPAKAQQQAAPTRAVMLKNLDAGFKSIDTNSDGALSSSELAAAEAKVQQQRLAQLRGRVEQEFTKLDTNKDGNLTKAEFMAAAPTTPQNAPNGAATGWPARCQ